MTSLLEGDAPGELPRRPKDSLKTDVLDLNVIVCEVGINFHKNIIVTLLNVI